MLYNYSINEHSHRFASWAASRAASTSPLCRFRVEDGVSWLELSGLDAKFQIDDLPEPQGFDAWHKDRRRDIVKKAKKMYPQFSHGIAAKLINVYLKSRFVNSGFINDPRVSAMHPPIDSVLLTELAVKDVGGHFKKWKEFDKKLWSKYDSRTYESVVKLIMKSLEGQPLWKIEYYWQGYQS